ncbi:MAG TPA: serine/threonine-protein kinase, partial [Anaerolineaceae bacterium]
MAELTGKVLAGRYRVDAFLGRGGMADVYKVWDQQRAVFLAMKVLHADLADDRVFLRRFEHEAQTLARLQHPNIVRFYGLEKAPDPAGGTASSGTTGNSAFIAPVAFILMDYIDGLTLRKEIFLNKSGLAPERILEVMRPVCAALFYAHQMGLAHCDIKPANIMLHRNGAVYLADFGIARMTEASAQSPGGMGTPAYMAPEQLHGREPTFAADIYSLGVVLFEMITGGRRPFTGDASEDAEKITWEKDHLPPIAPRKYAPSISPELESVILRCLERKPERRYHTALDLLEALQAAAGGAEDLDTLLTPTTQEEDSSPGAVVAGLRGTVKGSAPWLRFLTRPRLLSRPYSWLLAGLAAVLLAGLGLSILARDVHAPSLPIPGVTPPGASGMTVAGFTTTRGNRTTAAVTQSPRAGSTPPAENPTGTLTTSGAAAPQPTSLGGSQWIAYAF